MKIRNGKRFLVMLTSLLLITQTLLNPILATATTIPAANDTKDIQLSSKQQKAAVGQTFSVNFKQNKGDSFVLDLPEGVQYQKLAATEAQKVAKVEQKDEQLSIEWKKGIVNKEIDIQFKAKKVGDYTFRATGTDGTEKLQSNELTLKGYIRPQLKSGKANVDIDIAPAAASVQSGQDAAYALNFKATGMQTTYTNAEIKVELPANANFSQDVNTLKIAGIAPTYNTAAHTLTYHFPTLEAGKANQVMIKVATINGETPNDTALTAKASFTADNFLGDAADDAVVTVKAASSLTTSKAYTRTLDSSNQAKTTPPTAGDIGVWTIKVNADNKDSGLLYFKEGSKIKVVDTIPAGLTYVSDDAGGVYDATAKTVTWEFDPPTLADQKVATNLFSKTIVVNTKFNEDIKNLQKFNNTVKSQGTDVANQLIESVASASVFAGISDPNHVPDGISLWPPNHGGPIDGIGTAGATFNPNNPDPTVYDTALLRFSFTAEPGITNSYTKDFKKYEISYDIDPNLELSVLDFSSWANFSPEPTGTVSPDIAVHPRADIYITVNGVERKVFSDTEYIGKHYKRADLGVADTDHISNIRFDHTYAPAGLMTPFAYPTFTIKKGYTGQVINHVKYNVTGFNKAGVEVTWNNNTEVNDVNTLTGYRTANVVPKPPEAKPILANKINFATTDNGIVKAGENRITGFLKTDNASAVPSNSPFDMYVILPKGVTVDTTNPEYQLGDPDRWGEKTTTGANKDFGSIEIMANDYNGTGKQLVHIHWKEDALQPSKMLNYAFNVTIADTAPVKLVPEAYAFVGDTDFNVPDQTGDSITNSTKEVDTQDLNSDTNTNQSIIKTGNQYTLLREDEISTSKLVKGDQDTAFSKMGHASPGGNIDYQLKLTNDGKTNIADMVLIDVLPSIGDLGITDNAIRGSQFAPALTGPIQVPAPWAGKVAITYSTATNPSRTDLTKNVIYPSTTTPMTDPATAVEPNWLDASAVIDWSQIHSFKVTLLDNAEWVTGQDITLNFSMKAPSNLSKDLTDRTKAETSRAAWNSFAFASNNMQVVEPERVGVVVNADEPEIHKDVMTKQQLELTNRDESFDWHVSATFGNTTGTWTQAKITDKINDLLDITAVKVTDENGTDVTSKGTLTTTANNIIFELPKEAGSYAYLANHTYTMTVTTKIKPSAAESDLAPYVKDGGIPNQADLNFGSAGDVIHSEIPKVTPPPVNPDIHKDVMNTQQLNLTNRNESFDWHIQTTFGNTTGTWEQATITDKVNDLLDITTVKVTDENGVDVTSKGTLTTTDNNVNFELKKEAGSYLYLAGHTYTMTLTTKIKPSATDADLAPYVKDGGIPNQADLNFGSAGDVIHSEIPKVTPPPVNPVIHKDVMDEQQFNLSNRNNAFDWHVQTTFGNTTGTWTQAKISDQVNNLLEISKVKVTDENGIDVTSKGKLSIVDNNITFELQKEAGSYSYLAGHRYTMTITTKIKTSTTNADLAPHVKDGGIPNQADLYFGNTGNTIHSEIPTIMPPKAPGEPPKTKKADPPADPPKGQLPHTGDQLDQIWLYSGSILLLSLAALGITRTLRRRY